MIILGIDPAIRCTGYGVINCLSMEKIAVLDCGIIRNRDSMPHSECLRRLYCGFNELIKKFNPDVAALEDAFYRKNPNTLKILAMARGAIITSLSMNGVAAFEYSPRTAKKTITGMGGASKQQVAFIIAAMLNIDIGNIPEDATDALSLALCHAQIAMRRELAILLPRPL